MAASISLKDIVVNLDKAVESSAEVVINRLVISKIHLATGNPYFVAVPPAV